MRKNILVNLLVNASKYSVYEREIELTTAVVGEELVSRIKDQGISSPNVDKDNMLIRFFRVLNSTNVQGMRLGLYIVK